MYRQDLKHTFFAFDKITTVIDKITSTEFLDKDKNTAGKV